MLRKITTLQKLNRPSIKLLAIIIAAIIYFAWFAKLLKRL